MGVEEMYASTPSIFTLFTCFIRCLVTNCCSDAVICLSTSDRFLQYVLLFCFCDCLGTVDVVSSQAILRRISFERL